MSRPLALGSALYATVLLATGCGPEERYGPLGIPGSGWFFLVGGALLLTAIVLIELIRTIAGRRTKNTKNSRRNSGGFE